MTDVWFTSDHHFGHKNIIKYCNRPFLSVEEMDEELIYRWNSCIKTNDIVYYLGDFTLKNFNFAKEIFDRLKGKIYFIKGSHDCAWISTFQKQNENNYLGEMHTTKINNVDITMSHYSMRTWCKSHYGAYHLYGHSHGNLEGFGLSMDIGVDTNNYYPYNFHEIVSIMSKKVVTEYKIFTNKELKNDTKRLL